MMPLRQMLLDVLQQIIARKRQQRVFDLFNPPTDNPSTDKPVPSEPVCFESAPPEVMAAVRKISDEATAMSERARWITHRPGNVLCVGREGWCESIVADHLSAFSSAVASGVFTQVAYDKASKDLREAIKLYNASCPKSEVEWFRWEEHGQDKLRFAFWQFQAAYQSSVRIGLFVSCLRTEDLEAILDSPERAALKEYYVDSTFIIWKQLRSGRIGIDRLAELSRAQRYITTAYELTGESSAFTGAQTLSPGEAGGKHA